MEWEKISFKECTLSVNEDSVYFNSAMCNNVEEANKNGVDLFKAISDGKEILSFKPGNQFDFGRNKIKGKIVCKELAEYILHVYIGVSRFKLILNDEGYYILQPKKIKKADV